MLKPLFIFLFPLLTLIGCASAPLVAPPRQTQGIPGIYHRVERGQTLWRIAKIYGLELDELTSVNHIPDATNIEPGQLVFIPRQRQVQVNSRASGNEDFIWPLKGRVIASFGQDFNNTVNKGINIQARGGSDVLASRGGRVVFRSLSFANYGKTLIIDHGDGFSTVYASNSELMVNLGEQVQKGAVIARVGSRDGEGKCSYLHFEIRKGYSSQNPYFYLP
jgi:hypothetical protein